MRHAAVFLVAAAWASAAALRGHEAQRAATPAQLGDSLSPALIAQGDSIFRGKLAGGLCFTCHGQDARGLPGLAPSLRDSVWLHGDGGYAFVVKTVSTGVPRPKKAIAPMLPMGGTKLSPQQIRAVAAYVLSLRRGG
jgi:mono/diheme cytochrome c family protein